LFWNDCAGGRDPACLRDADDVEVRMIGTRVLVAGATGRRGRAVVDLLIDAGVPVRALTHRSETAATSADLA
jgi:NADPH:quinone reductase-like Zn-dependent oxidoreductase